MNVWFFLKTNIITVLSSSAWKDLSCLIILTFLIHSLHSRGSKYYVYSTIYFQIRYKDYPGLLNTTIGKLQL